MTSDSRTDDAIDDPRPFQIEVAERVKRFPAYLFARINAIKYQKRRAGDDVIDLGMGNPSDPPQELVIEKLAEAARDPQEPRLQQSARHHEPAPRGGRQVFQEVRRAARSRERSDRLPRLEGRLQPHVPGADRAGRHGDRAGPVLFRCTCMPWRWRRPTSSRWKWPTAKSFSRTSPTPASTCIPSRSC